MQDAAPQRINWRHSLVLAIPYLLIYFHPHSAEMGPHFFVPCKHSHVIAHGYLAISGCSTPNKLEQIWGSLGTLSGIEQGHSGFVSISMSARHERIKSLLCSIPLILVYTTKQKVFGIFQAAENTIQNRKLYLRHTFAWEQHNATFL